MPNVGHHRSFPRPRVANQHLPQIFAQPADSLSGKGRDFDPLRVVVERQRGGRPDPRSVDLVHDHHPRRPRCFLQHVPIVRGERPRSIDNNETRGRNPERLPGSRHSLRFDRIAGHADAGRVDQIDGESVQIHRLRHEIAGGAGNGGDDGARRTQ